MARRFLGFCNGLLNTVVFIILLVLGRYAGFALWDNQQIYMSAENVQADMLMYKAEKSDDEDSVAKMFQDLREINPDVRAWLTLDQTKIDYPLLYGATNQSYLNRNVYEEFSISGSIFIDSRCNPELRSCYTLVHGHHMTNRQMFGDLDLYKDQKFFEENRTGTIILPDRTYSLLTAACLIVDSMDQVIFEPEKWADDIEKPLRYAQSIALHYDNEQIERLLQENEEAKNGGKPPQIVALATCSTEYDTARTVLLAEMIEVQPDEEKEEEI